MFECKNKNVCREKKAETEMEQTVHILMLEANHR